MENDKGILLINMIIGTLGLIIIGIGLLKYYESVGGTAFYALSGFPLLMIYLHYLEGKARLSNKILWIRFIIVSLVLVIVYILFFR
ncbi:hypothetical protein [Sporosarcina sp. UB5]|uniref:hypothetical protein n=1 Tax=Sporosarcina sp. UB5 TaxID=3047463 RepID=UPI003D792EE2